MKRITVSALALIAILGCKNDSPDAQIKKAFDSSVKGIESSDPGSAVEALSPDFAGPENMNRDEAKLYLMGLLNQGKIGITVVSSRLEVKGSRADQGVELVVTSRGDGSVLPQDATHRQFQLRWEEQDGHWRLKELQETGAR